MFEPITFPRTSTDSFARAAFIPIISSGREVAVAISRKLIANSLKWKNREIIVKDLIRIWADFAISIPEIRRTKAQKTVFRIIPKIL